MLDMKFIVMKKSDLILLSWNLSSKRGGRHKKIKKQIYNCRYRNIIYRQITGVLRKKNGKSLILLGIAKKDPEEVTLSSQS